MRRGDRYLPYTGRAPVVRPAPQAAPAPQSAPVYAPEDEIRRCSAARPERLRPRACRRSRPAKAKAVLRAPDDGPIDYAKAYGPITDDVFPIQAFNYKKMNPAFLRQENRL